MGQISMTAATAEKPKRATKPSETTILENWAKQQADFPIHSINIHLVFKDRWRIDIYKKTKQEQFVPQISIAKSFFVCIDPELGDVIDLTRK